MRRLRQHGGRLAAAFLAVAVVAPATAVAQRPAVTIPGPLDGPLPRYAGAPVAAQPLKGPWLPVNPAAAGDGRSGSGLAPGNGAASPFPGPLGRLPTRDSTALMGCASLALDARDRLLALCNGPLGPALHLVDPKTLDALASATLPGRRGTDINDRAGGTHFLLRADGTALVPTNDGALVTIAVEAAGLRQTGSRSLTGLLAGGERPLAVGAGYDGHDWVAGNGGTVVTVPRDGAAAPKALRLGEPISEDLATDPSGTYVVTAAAVYRLRAGADGTPEVVWRHALAPGGSGTPPAIVAGGYVAVADASDPPKLLALRTRGGAARRLACAVPLFAGRPGRVTAHLVVAGRSVVATNGHGYTGPFVTEGGRTTTGGIARVIVSKRGCRTAWTSDVVSPSAQPVVSRATGLLYTLDKPEGFPDRWDLAALDWRTGALRWQALAGEGLGYNSDHGAVVLGPDGVAYAGTFGGIVRFEDVG